MKSESADQGILAPGIAREHGPSALGAIEHGAGGSAGFLGGTRVATKTGDVPVESLVPGDLAVTATGAARPVRRLTRWRSDQAGTAGPPAVHPVRVAAGAFGPRLPARDLTVSPGQALAVGQVLVSADALVNGATVTWAPVAEATYWCVELDRPEMILVEGVAAASRRPAAKGGGRASAAPPVLETGAEIDALRATLFQRAKEMGHQTSSIHDLHLVADGARIDAIVLGPRRFVFAAPADCAELALNSQTFVPRDSDPPSGDRRILGVPVKRLQIDGEDLDLRSLPASGWHALEKRPTHIQRWTTGLTPLPPKARVVLVDLAGEGRYWQPRASGGLTLVK